MLDCIPLLDIENVVLVSQSSHSTMLEGQITKTTPLNSPENDLSVESPGNERPNFRRAAKAALEASRRSAQSAHEDCGEENVRAFNVITRAGGNGGGRTYSLRVSSESECKDWVDGLLSAVSKAKKRAEMTALGSGLSRVRGLARRAYNSTWSQTFFALVIVASFISSLAEAEIQPKQHSKTSHMFAGLELGFAIVFALELAFNMFGSWMSLFISSGWNWFDALVVLVSFVSLSTHDLPGVNLVRFIRVFRVVKLLKFNKSLRHLINALTASIFPVMNSLIIFLLFTCIYAVLATNIFGRQESLDQGPGRADLAIREEYFGSFSSSLFTMVSTS